MSADLLSTVIVRLLDRQGYLGQPCRYSTTPLPPSRRGNRLVLPTKSGCFSRSDGQRVAQLEPGQHLGISAIVLLMLHHFLWYNKHPSREPEQDREQSIHTD